jgi:outer membrane immunogenic protein
MKQLTHAAPLFLGLSLFSSAALAGGLDVVVVNSEPYDWTGFYAGLNAGIVKHSMDITDNQATSFYATIQQVSNPQFTGGFQLGYLYQMALAPASGVFGIEFNGNFTNARSSEQYGSPFALYQLEIENKLKNFFLLQLIGGIAADRTLLFLTAGFSWSDISGHVTNEAGIPFFDSFSFGKTSFGTTVGGGIEYAITDSFSARFEVDVVTPRTYSASDDNDDEFDFSSNIVRGVLGINYRFG